MKHALHTLEFDKVKERLRSHAASSLGKDKADRLEPSADREEVAYWQDETDEAVHVLRVKGNVPLGGVFDIRPQVKRAQIGGMLNPKELLDISSTLYGAKNMKRFIENLLEEEEVELPILNRHAEEIVTLTNLERRINQSIDDSGRVMDSASEKLRGIRNDLRTTEARIREKLENLTRSSSTQKMLSDAIVTIRNDRFVVPVKQEYRGSFGGMVHDQSSSGATLFIEPQAVVEANNKLQEAKMREKHEVDRILAELSAFVAEDADILLQLVGVLADLDFMFAKGMYSQAIKGSKPAINDEGYMKLNRARHPLIPLDEVVASDVELGGDFSSIVITGPNTGGKTVTLKTIGLIALMAQAGLQVPAHDGSAVTVFEKVFADIGDEQSIEQSLSTFSSHMTNIVEILKHVDHKSLVLFDELGAGTDPQEGAALAIAILDEVYSRGARVVATTHYPELKAYGYNRKGAINASVEFDIETLSPTYRLLIGIPGKSNAFEISKRLGLDTSIIENARGYIGTETNKVENMIASLEQSRKSAERERDEAVRLREEAAAIHQELEEKLAAFTEQREAMMKDAEKKANEAVNLAKEQAEEIITDIRQMQKRQNNAVKEHELIDARKKLEDAAPELAKKRPSPGKVHKAGQQELLPGDEVNVISLGRQGHIVEQSGDNEFTVQLGIMKMKVKRKDLEYINRPQPVETKPMATVKGSTGHVKPELDLRGERFEDALLKVEKYLDDALLAGYPSVTIIHGKGTGALRKGVQEWARKQRAIKNIRSGGMNEGGGGVTVLELK
ncbi:endonuclease MutS2 [Bacillus marinisedimentorum]|uniref:endonuclease MutS2 n=1 Tax=Bacillus marinisedimentorum TaxID=1821260 RepID=UPI000872CABB|nr:endonuclease MutS2 [Bacillus marinisedimentorum]